MSEQSTMTREQLEAAGYEFYILAHTTLWCAAIDGWQRPSVSIETALIAATAHYRQQQELAALRVGLANVYKQIVQLQDITPSRYSARGSAVYAIGDYLEYLLSTVSESERTD